MLERALFRNVIRPEKTTVPDTHITDTGIITNTGANTDIIGIIKLRSGQSFCPFF